MGRKTITTYKLNKIKKLVNEGKTIKDIAGQLKISTATVANYRAYFKKKGEIILPSKNALLAENSQITKEEKQNLNVKMTTSDTKGYIYIINGTKLAFNSQPKEIMFGDNKIIIEM